MSSIIDFLETMGQNARLRDGTQAELKAALLQAEIEPPLQAAVLDRDPQALQSLLGVSGNLCCLVNAPTEDEGERADVRQG